MAKLYWIVGNVMLVGKIKLYNAKYELRVLGTCLKFPVSEIWNPVTKKSQYTLMIMFHHQDGNLDGSEWKILWKCFVIQIYSVNASTEHRTIVLSHIGKILNSGWQSQE